MTPPTDGRPAGPAPARTDPPTSAVGEHLLEVVRAREQEALDRWTRVLDGRSVCREPDADAKHLEGRAAALAVLRRALVRTGAHDQRRGDADHADLTALEEASRRWREVTAGGGGPAWDAYRTGGRQALAELAALLTVTR